MRHFSSQNPEFTISRFFRSENYFLNFGFVVFFEVLFLGRFFLSLSLRPSFLHIFAHTRTPQHHTPHTPHLHNVMSARCSECQSAESRICVSGGSNQDSHQCVVIKELARNDGSTGLPISHLLSNRHHGQENWLGDNQLGDGLVELDTSLAL